MRIDSSSFGPSALVNRAAAVALFACASTLGLQAQQADAARPTDTQIATSAPDVKPDLKLDLSGLSDAVSYSSSAEPLVSAESATLDFKGLALQPPPRRRYGRPRYNDSNHNADGSAKWAFIAGVGLTLPTGNLHKYDTPSYSFQVGGGRNFNKHFAVLAQFDWDNFGLQGSNLNNQLNLYSTLCPPSNANCLTPSTLDGNSHIWSFTVDPTYTFYQGEAMGAYVVGGVGFYHKVTSFLTPQEGEYCDPYYGYCEEYVANALYDHYTSNAVGFNGGFGITFKPSHFANEKFYAEARYVFVDNQQRSGYTIANVNDPNTPNSNSAYPANSNRSTYIPVKFGIRF